MANTNNLYGTNKPGPSPVFTERIEVRLRKEQTDRLARFSKAFGMSQSDLIRLAIDQFSSTIEDGPMLKIFESKAVA